jgi:DNA polymerase-1
MKIIRNIPPEFPKNTWVALDVEIFQLNKKTMHRPTTGKFACLTVCADPNKVYLIDEVEAVPITLANIRDCIWILHNAKFDITHLRRWANIIPRKKLWDTLLIDRILWGGYFNKFSLKDLVRRYLSIYLDKSLAKTFGNTDILSDELVTYSCTDTSVTLRVCEAQRKFVKKSHMKIWNKIDRPTLWAVLDFQGFRLDVDKWATLAIRNEDRKDKLDAELPFNPRSPKQVKQALGTRNAQADTLKKFIIKNPGTEKAQYAQMTIDSKKYGTRASRYGMSFIDNHLETDPRLNEPYSWIHCDYIITGAETGRMAASKPNMQNIIARDTNEFRKCFIARPGNDLIIADYSQQEIGIAAYLSQDEALIKAVNSDRSVYIELALEVFGKEITKDDKLYDDMKSVILGTDYGMSKYGLANALGVSVDEAAMLLVTFFKKFPGLGYYMEQQEKKVNFVETVIGRKAWLNKYNDQSPRNARNSPIQGTAADMMKRALGQIHQNWTFDYPFACVEVTHDEVGFDVPKEISTDVANFVTCIMVSVANEMCEYVINFKASAYIGDSWAVK